MPERARPDLASAAASIYPNLPSADRVPPQRQQPRLADALYPHLAPPKPKSAEEKYYDRQREILLKHLREANARLQGERGSR